MNIKSHGILIKMLPIGEFWENLLMEMIHKKIIGNGKVKFILFSYEICWPVVCLDIKSERSVFLIKSCN